MAVVDSCCRGSRCAGSPSRVERPQAVSKLKQMMRQRSHCVGSEVFELVFGADDVLVQTSRGCFVQEFGRHLLFAGQCISGHSRRRNEATAEKVTCLQHPHLDISFILPKIQLSLQARVVGCVRRQLLPSIAVRPQIEQPSWKSEPSH